MDGIHDLGGMDGFGAVHVEADEPVFHEPWEFVAFGVNALAISLLRAYNADEYRHAIERMRPAHYLAASYYERTLTGVASLLVEKGVVSREDLEQRAGGSFPLSQPAASVAASAHPTQERPLFQIGDPVRVRDIHPAGHTRVPRYARGKRGEVIHVAPRFSFPDASAHELPTREEPTYHVQFRSEELWTDAADPRSTVVVDLWESYLEPAG